MPRSCERVSVVVALLLEACAFPSFQGLKVHVVEQKDMVGGACKTERPFANAPDLQQSTGAYLLGLMPPELLCLLDIELPCIRRDPHNFLPTTGDAYLLFGTDVEATKAQFLRFFSQKDWEANCRLQAELAAIRDDVAPTWVRHTSGTATAQRSTAQHSTAQSTSTLLSTTFQSARDR